MLLYNNNNKRPLTPKSMPPAGDAAVPVNWWWAQANTESCTTVCSNHGQSCTTASASAMAAVQTVAELKAVVTTVGNTLPNSLTCLSYYSSTLGLTAEPFFLTADDGVNPLHSCWTASHITTPTCTTVGTEYGRSQPAYRLCACE